MHSVSRLPLLNECKSKFCFINIYTSIVLRRLRACLPVQTQECIPLSFQAGFTPCKSTQASLVSSWNLIDSFMSHLQSCSSLYQLNQVYAKMTRFQVLELYPAPFYWNSLMRPYLRLSSPYMALRVYIQMLRAGILPDCYTLPIAFKAVCQVLVIEWGRQLHSFAIRIGLEVHEFVESGLINVYSKAGDFDGALQIFAQNPYRKLGSWNALIGGFAQGGRSKEAIYLFLELRRFGILPDDVTMVSVASACGSVGDLSLALQIHKCAYQAKSLSKSDILMSNSLIDMYGKCGQLDLAYKVFVGMVERNVSTWTSMIVSLAMHGHVNEALDFFREMRQSGIWPNEVTFVGVLSACVHGGLVEEGSDYFNAMAGEYGIRPQMSHYGCMVDLLGRVGRLTEARELVRGMPMKPNSVIWGTLLGACEKHGNVEIGEWVAMNLLELEPWNDGVYVVLSNIYAAASLWSDVQRIRRMMTDRKVAKTPGYSMATTSNGSK
ncbi:pentatricopeptide repeat-containing protein At1g77170, mitochondrial-like [Aristolochia californica]|uniref:pentatricopeptide repeat-containing protein At1g77170, mitochondrial-like n=1 Tax=Aristolochia californica TaxID=171875 RepID=UPI0035DCFB16